MEKEKITKVKKFPRFWTYFERDGKVTIHQVRFKALLTYAKTQRTSWGAVYWIAMAVYDIANTNKQWVSQSTSHEHELCKIYLTKEDVLRKLRGEEVESIFKYSNFEGVIPSNNILYNSEWAWNNHIPRNTFIDRKGDLCGYVWDGIKTKMVSVTHIYPEDLKVCGVPFKPKHNYPIFDMVASEYLGVPSTEYYLTEEECNENHQIEVFEFDD